MGDSGDQLSEMLTKILDCAPQKISFLAPDLSIRYCNQAYADLHNRTKQSMVGERIEGLYDPHVFKLYAEKFAAAVGGESQVFEFAYEQPNGQLSIETRLVPNVDDDGAVDGVFAYCVDQTKYKQQWLNAKRNFDVALKSQSVAFWRIDKSSEDWIYAEHIERLLGLAPQTLGNSIRSFLDRLHPADRELSVFKQGMLALEGDHCEVEFRCLTSKGEYRWFRLNANWETGEDDVTDELTGTFTDIDQLKKVEILAANHLKYRDSFLSMLSHELRNPVAGIQYAIDVFEHDSSELRQLPPQCKTSINIIKRQTSVVTRLLNDLLNGSRASLDQILFEEELICFPELLQEVLQAAASIYQKKDQEIEFFSDRSSAMIKGDRVRLTQALTNLIDNASKFSEHNSKIAVHCREQGGDIVTCISDSGPGIAPSDQANVFELFYQTPQSLGRKGGGFGVGLYLVKKIVDAHDGVVTVTSPGRLGGADFEIRLPLDDVNTVSETKEVYTKSNSLVLIEDNEDARLALTMALKARGFDVTAFHDGQHAIDNVPSLAPRTVLIDIGLPGKDGLVVISELRQHKNLSGTFFVALTGYGQKHEREMILNAGFHDHLVKPVDIADLCTVILNRSRN